MNQGENIGVSNELYDAALSGIPAQCRKRRCSDAYAQALAETIAFEAIIEQGLVKGDLPAITPESVKHEVAVKVGTYCSAECLAFFTKR